MSISPDCYQTIRDLITKFGIKDVTECLSQSCLDIHKEIETENPDLFWNRIHRKLDIVVRFIDMGFI